MNDWLAALNDRLLEGKPTVRVVVANVIGSAPREIGATMLIGETTTEGTIGGGHLEWKAIEIARSMLAQPQRAPLHVERLLLGAMLGQCCGGAVELWLERYDMAASDIIASALAQRGKNLLLLTTRRSTPQRRLIDRDELLALNLVLPRHFDSTGVALLRAGNDISALVERIDVPHKQLWLFGAGHVGKALVKILADLPLRITWIDGRQDMFARDLPCNVTTLCTECPNDAVNSAPADAWYLVLTHNHDLDYAICRAVLTRNDFAWLGLIGSQTKSTHFRNRLQRHGINADVIERVTCPIGLPSMSSKLPAAIAVSVAAQLIGLFEQSNSTSNFNYGNSSNKSPFQEASNGAMQAQSLQRSHLPGSYA